MIKNEKEPPFTYELTESIMDMEVVIDDIGNCMFLRKCIFIQL